MESSPAVDQGVLPHLLAVAYLVGRQPGAESELLGVLPGVDFTTCEAAGASTGQRREADIVAIFGGRVLLGECKANGATLTSDNVHKTLWLADRFRDPIVVFATPTTFDQAAEATDLLRSWSGTEIELWEKPDMLDPRPHPDATAPEPRDYLVEIIEWLRESENG
ncbi:MAG: hypothetical protein M3Q03_05600 [Chloroflexota bacterium]|nr:hypothetical protein [Chloroflexota bacterium]